MNSEKTVWLIGSGFSKSLGGPLLRDLFRQEREEDLRLFFHPETYPDLAKALPWVQACFQNGVKEGLWENAEQFLAYVDDGESGDCDLAKGARILNLVDRYDPWPDQVKAWRGAPMPEHQLFLDHKKYKADVPKGFYRKVKRALAAECHRFLLGPLATGQEKWLPYREWVKALRPGIDTVVCFNYDRVIEMAAEAVSQSSKMWIAMPNQKQPADTVAVLKLHGSVDWRLKIDQEEPRPNVLEGSPIPADEILRSSEDDIAIAAPGASKSRFVDMYLKPLWDRAEDALTAASRLLVVGYSLPETDPSAQYRLLEAFGLGSTAPLGRWAHIDLGPDVMTPVHQRMVSLIRSTGGSQVTLLNSAATEARSVYHLHVIAERLYAQDFIGRHARFTTTQADLQHAAMVAAQC